jgi:hypothetical protein
MGLIYDSPAKSFWFILFNPEDLTKPMIYE